MIDSKEEEPNITDEQKKLIDSYKKFSSNAIEVLLSSETQNDKDLTDLIEYLEKNRDRIKIPLFLTCKDYYKDGSKTMQIGFFIDFIISAIFGASIGLLTTLLSEMPYYWIYASTSATICLIIVITYSIRKKIKSRV